MTVYLVTCWEAWGSLRVLGVALDPAAALRRVEAERKVLRLLWVGDWSWHHAGRSRAAQRAAVSPDGWPGAPREYAFYIEATETLDAHEARCTMALLAAPLRESISEDGSVTYGAEIQPYTPAIRLEVSS